MFWLFIAIELVVLFLFGLGAWRLLSSREARRVAALRKAALTGSGDEPRESARRRKFFADRPVHTLSLLATLIVCGVGVNLVFLAETPIGAAASQVFDGFMFLPLQIDQAIFPLATFQSPPLVLLSAAVLFSSIYLQNWAFIAAIRAVVNWRRQRRAVPTPLAGLDTGQRR